jgi:hypothetical protein
VLHRRVAGVGGDPSGPPLHDLRVDGAAAAARAAQQIVAVPVGGAGPVQPFAGVVAYDVRAARGLQVP